MSVGGDRRKATTTRDVLEALRRHGELRVEEVAARAGYSTPATRKALVRLLERGDVTRRLDRCAWAWSAKEVER